MKSEKYNFQKNDRPSYFNHLLLDSERRMLLKVSNQEGYDSTQLEVKLELNGVVVRVEDFNVILKGWGERICNQIKQELDYYGTQEAVVKKAEELIKDKIGNIYTQLQSVEDSLWKLED